MKKFITILFSAISSLFVAYAIGLPAVAPLLFAGAIVIGKVSPSFALAGLITPADITWNGKEVMGYSESILTQFFEKPDLTQFHTIYSGIKAKQQIVFLGNLGLIGKSRATCDTTADGNTIDMSEKFWNPCSVGFRLEQCWKDLKESFWIWGLKNGIAKEDLTGSDFDNFIQLVASDAMMEATLRMAWFGDVDSANANDTPTGHITAGVDVDYFNCFDGFWKQAFDIVTADSTKRAGTITKNSGVSYTAQNFDSTDTTNKVAIGYMEALVYNADYRLRSAKNKIIIATQSLVDQYVKELRSFSNVDASYQRIEGGYTAIMFEGIQIVGFSFLDRMIRAYQDNGTTYYLPHRAMFTTKDNLGIGTEQASNLEELKAFFSDYNEVYVLKALWNLDAKILQDHMIEVIY